jgi:hypothetical protein
MSISGINHFLNNYKLYNATIYHSEKGEVPFNMISKADTFNIMYISDKDAQGEVLTKNADQCDPSLLGMQHSFHT